MALLRSDDIIGQPKWGGQKIVHFDKNPATSENVTAAT